MKISYEIQIWFKQMTCEKDTLGIPNSVGKFSNKRAALSFFEKMVKHERENNMQDIEHMVLMEYGANKEFPDDGNVIAEW